MRLKRGKRAVSEFIVAALLFFPLHNVHAQSSAFDLPHRPQKPRNVFLPPLISFVLPGFDQIYEEQYRYGLVYAGVGVAGLTYAANTAYHADERHLELGAQLLTAAGGFSMYHSFRSAVRPRQANGEFAFLKVEESPAELALAPFDVSYLTRVTTLIPVFVAIGLGFIGFSSADRTFKPQEFSAADAYFATTRSYLAGTWEEAAFRGWMMPLATQYTGSPFAGNLITATLFGAAHIQKDFIPWPQFVSGLYLGYLVQKDDWRLGEAIFAHAWYDFFLFLGGYLKGEDQLSVTLPTLRLSF